MDINKRKKPVFPPNSGATIKMKTTVWFVLVLSALFAAGEVFQGKLGTKASLECGLNGLKMITWNHGNDLVVRDIIKTGLIHKGNVELAHRSKVSGSTLVISNLKKEDVGNFTCIADEKSRDHTLLMVLVSVSPSSKLQLGSSATLHCEVRGLQGQGQWHRPDGSVLKGSEVNLKSVARSDAGTWVCTFNHAGKTYSEKEDITVIEVTTTTSMTTSQSLKVNGLAPAHNGPLLGISWWMWVAVGVGCLVMVFLMVSVIVLYKKIQRRKKRLHKMKNGRPLKPRQYCQCDHSTAAAKPKLGRRREKPSALPPLLMV